MLKSFCNCSSDAVKSLCRSARCACRDPDDDLILEMAMLGQAHYAVSRDDDIKRDRDLIRHLQAHGVAILSVQQFLDKLDAGEI